MACPTPEHLIAQHCQHAPHTDLARLLGEIEAALKDQEELLEGLSEQSLARLEVWEQDNGMWAVDGLLAADTGALLAKLLTTAVAPPRQGDCEPDTGSGTEASTTSGVEPEAALPPQANRNAEALHQMLASFGTDPHAPKRHGHTATLHLVCDLVTLQGDGTGRLPTLEGRPISLAKARLLACEGQAIPSIFDYTTGEAIELGRTMRLPNAALRRKLELEQPGGCAWTGCGRPVHWTEAHHVRAWWAGGETNADNLILLCRFHHGRIHTPDGRSPKPDPAEPSSSTTKDTRPPRRTWLPNQATAAARTGAPTLTWKRPSPTMHRTSSTPASTPPNGPRLSKTTSTRPPNSTKPKPPGSPRRPHAPKHEPASPPKRPRPPKREHRHRHPPPNPNRARDLNETPNQPASQHDPTPDRPHSYPARRGRHPRRGRAHTRRSNPNPTTRVRALVVPPPGRPPQPASHTTPSPPGRTPAPRGLTADRGRHTPPTSPSPPLEPRSHPTRPQRPRPPTTLLIAARPDPGIIRPVGRRLALTPTPLLPSPKT
ncbi:hypothetical protein GCM10029992_20400 [Glycomyces albus]